MGIQFQTAAFASAETGDPTNAPFIVCAMFTPSHRAKAERLVRTLTAHSLPFAAYESPHVHRSVSIRGVADIAYAKPRLIAGAWARFGKPVVYLDADFEVCAYPWLFHDYATAGFDFAIYNWRADLMNDAWGPDMLNPDRHASGQARYWRFGFAIDKVSNTQMLCSGGVQYWAPTPAARSLLAAWEDRIEAAQDTPDDESLDLVLNFSPEIRCDLRSAWLPKDYVRSVHWPYVAPTLNHRDIPSPRVAGHFHHLGDVRVKATELKDISKVRPFPRDAIMDLVTGRILVADWAGRQLELPLTRPICL